MEWCRASRRLPRIPRFGSGEAVSMRLSPRVLVPAALLASSVLLGFDSVEGRPAASGSGPGGTSAAEGGSTPESRPDTGKVEQQAPIASSSARVGGDRAAKVERIEEQWVFEGMRVETPLPEGYPAPTPPGAIDLKTYPSVRRAEFTGSGNSDLGMNFGFWPLFQHIKRREIAMTSPVEMDYTGWEGTPESAAGNWTMSFLYRTADLGPIGQDGKVRVVDCEPITVIAVGLRGAYRLSTVAEGIAQLETWLADNTEWERSGDPRAFYYNGPEQRNADKWSEAQLPIRRKVVPGSPTPVSAEPTTAPALKSMNP